MTTLYYDTDGDLAALDGQSIAVVGYGNQGRSWALNLRDSGLDVRVHARADASREQAEGEGFAVGDVGDADAADVVCILIPDDVIAGLGLHRRVNSASSRAAVRTTHWISFPSCRPSCVRSRAVNSPTNGMPSRGAATRA